MGKKDDALMAKLKPKFFENCANSGYDEGIVHKIWENWQSFAKYAFNKSHSVAYGMLPTGWVT